MTLAALANKTGCPLPYDQDAITIATLEERIKDLRYELRDREYTIKQLKDELVGLREMKRQLRDGGDP